MKLRNIFSVSLCKSGLLGGLLYIEENRLLYCTNKLTVPENMRRLSMLYHEIVSIEKAPLHTVSVSMKTGEVYRFLIFSRKKFLKRLTEKPFIS